MRVRELTMIALLGLGTVACGGGNEPVRIATFNVGLAPGYEEHVIERKGAIQTAVAAQAAELDLLCVQEYWDEDHWQDLVAATAAELPHALRRAAEPGPASCTAADLDPLIACLEEHCAGTSGDALASCALEHCAGQVSALPGGCVACVTQDLTLPLEQIYLACTSGTISGGEDTPALYGGVFEVGILSRHPFIATDSTRLDAFMVRVGVLYAKIATDAGELNVFCTHLNSAIGGWQYGGAHGSWREENAFEAQQLVDYVDAKTAGGGAAVILGDLNTGSGFGAVVDEWPESFAVLTGAGFSDPFLAQPDATCSLCPENSLRSPGGGAKLVDHVLLRDFEGEATVARLFTEPVTVETGGEAITTNLSDHYGLVVTLAE